MEKMLRSIIIGSKSIIGIHITNSVLLGLSLLANFVGGRDIFTFLWNGKAHYPVCISPEFDDPDQIQYSTYPPISFKITLPFTAGPPNRVLF